MSRAERRTMVIRAHPALSLSRQCRLLSIGRSSLYYTPKGESPETLALMRRIDELFLKYPAASGAAARRAKRPVLRPAPVRWSVICAARACASVVAGPVV